MIEQIPLRTGHKYTIYSSFPYPRKREVIFTKRIPEYLKSEAGKRVAIGHYRSAAQMELLLYIEPSSDLIVPGWNHPNLASIQDNQVIFEGGFGEGFSLTLQNLNPNFTAYKTLFFLDGARDFEPTQLFPVTKQSEKTGLQVC